MKIKIKATLEVTALYDFNPEVDNIDDVKSSDEWSHALQEMICDEITMSDGVGCVDILDDSREFIEDQED